MLFLLSDLMIGKNQCSKNIRLRKGARCYAKYSSF